MKKLIIIMAIIALSWGVADAEEENYWVEESTPTMKLYCPKPNPIDKIESRLKALEDRVKKLEDNQIDWGSGAIIEKDYWYNYNCQDRIN